jgi:hypothetical protein
LELTALASGSVVSIPHANARIEADEIFAPHAPPLRRCVLIRCVWRIFGKADCTSGIGAVLLFMSQVGTKVKSRAVKLKEVYRVPHAVPMIILIRSGWMMSSKDRRTNGLGVHAI